MAAPVDANMNIYVVDDNADLRNSLKFLLERRQYSVQTFSSAAEFLASASDLPPGCLLLDMRMPGMSGLSLQRELIQSRSPHQIIFSSGAGEVADVCQAIDAGAIDFLAKPYRSADLISAISRAEERLRRGDSTEIGEA